ncbi:transcription antitermination factor NusB [bacterium]|nr:transcription antitermination factor NusB [bacterium]
MGQRREARKLTLISLYSWEVAQEQEIEKIIDYCLQFNEFEGCEEFYKDLLYTIIQHVEKIDALIVEKSKNWDFERISIIDKNILRIGIAELLFFPDIPPKSSIDEGIELAKVYGSKKSSNFVNGILDAVYHDILAQEENV